MCVTNVQNIKKSERSLTRFHNTIYMMYNMLAKHLAATAAIKLHVKQKTFMCASLLLALTVQAAIVVLPVCAHGVLFTDKHHFSYAHLHQTCSLQGTAHTEQFLWTNIDKHYKYTLNDSSRYSQHSAHHFNLKQEKVKGKQSNFLTTMSSSVTRGCRLFTVIFVPSKGLKVG